MCLQIQPSQRKTPEELLNLPIFENFLKKDAREKEDCIYENIITRKMDELYYLWQLAGGDVSVELKKQGLIRSRPPILSIPKYFYKLHNFRDFIDQLFNLSKCVTTLQFSNFTGSNVWTSGYSWFA